MKALIVEDEKPLADIYAGLFNSIGFEVTIVDSMQLAAQVIISDPAQDVITLDLNLTDSTAPDTIEKIADIRKQNPNAILVVVSGVLTPEDGKRAMALGADGVIEKIDASTPKGFWSKLGDIVASIFTSPSMVNRHGPLIEAIAQKIAAKRNADGLALGGAKPDTTIPAIIP